MITVLALLGILAVAGYTSRRRIVARYEADVAARRPLGPDGIIDGAEPIVRDLPGAPAVLLLHGGGDTPQTLRYLADHLVACGYAVHAPLLPGHGSTLRAFSRVTAQAWMQRVREEYAAMSRVYDSVSVVGLSMGGALGARLAAERPVPALVLLAPYLAMPPLIARAARWARAWGVLVPYVRSSAPQPSIKDPREEQRSLAYGVFSAGALRALYDTVRAAAAALPLISAPTLVLQSTEDGRIAAADARRAFERIGAAEKRLVWLNGTGHIITVDYGREQVFEAVVNWLDTHRQAARALA